MKKIMIAVLLSFSTITFAGGPAVQTWWENDYKNTIEPQQQQAVEEQRDERCERKLERFEELTYEYPEDAYFAWQYKLWLEKCR